LIQHLVLRVTVVKAVMIVNMMINILKLKQTIAVMIHGLITEEETFE
jgi:hypothetical protein